MHFPHLMKRFMMVMGAATIGAPLVSTADAQDPFVRYATPGQCEQATIRLKRQYWRDKRPDTVVYKPDTDSTPASVLQAARACAAKFNVASVPEHELLNLAQLYLLAGQDDLAKSAVDRFLGTQRLKDTTERGWQLNLVSTSYLQARPTRMPEARQYLSQLDALGKSVASSRMFAHIAFARHAMSINDLVGSIAEGKEAVAMTRAMTKNDRIDWAFASVSAFGALADPISVQTGGFAALAAMDDAATDLLPLRPAETQELAALRSSINATRTPYTLFGEKGAPLQADHWYNTKGENGWPKPNTVSLIIMSHHSCGANCYPMYSTLRRLNEKFGARGLQIILVSSTSGFYRNRLQTPGNESDSAGFYFGDFLKLPTVIGMNESKFTRKIDGRRITEPTANGRNYSRGRSGILVDKQGIVRMVVNVAPNREQALEARIEAALQQ